MSPVPILAGWAVAGFARRHWKPLAVVLGALLLAFGARWWLHHRDQEQRAVGAVLERLRGDSVRAVRLAGELRTATAAREAASAGVDTAITRWRTIRLPGRVDTLPPETLTVYVERLARAGDSVVRACTALQGKCAEEKRAADSVIAGQWTTIADLRSLLAKGATVEPPKARSCWGVAAASFAAGAAAGGTAGYVLGDRRRDPHAAPAPAQLRIPVGSLPLALPP